MKRPVIVVKGAISERDVLINYLSSLGVNLKVESSIESLFNILTTESPMALLIDMDSIALNNKLLRQLHQKSPKASLLLISSNKSHPEMEEAIGHYVYACISKPFDMDEVEFWLKSILDDECEVETLFNNRHVE